MHSNSKNRSRVLSLFRLKQILSLALPVAACLPLAACSFSIPQQTTTNAPADAQPATTQNASALSTDTGPFALEKSPLIHAGPNGSLGVAAADGSPIDGVKVSTHDVNIQSPSMVVTPDGVIHIAFYEWLGQGTDAAIYYRSSADGGKSWTEAKNLSESMVNLMVGRCRIAADAAGNVYVIWRVGAGQYIRTDIASHANYQSNNLVYRVLSGGQWNPQPIQIHPPATYTNQLIGSCSDFVSTDPTGKVHVVWNEMPDTRHPEVMFGTPPSMHAADVGNGLVMEVTLNGVTPTVPREIYMTPATNRPNGAGPIEDGLDMLDGYVDATDQAHFIASVGPVRGGEGGTFNLFENGGQTPGVTLPGGDSPYWTCGPSLLLDAQGQRHILTMYPAGEHPNVRDYTVGANIEPKTIRAVPGAPGTVSGLTTYQGASGQMVALMNMNDTGDKTSTELYVSMSNGGPWSPPVNVTNNTGKITFKNANTSLHSNAASLTWGTPGASAAALDSSGHLLLLYVRNNMGEFGVNALGVQIAGSSSSTPNLMFLRF